MMSWKLLRYLNIFSRHPIERHPVYQRESLRAIDWTRLGERLTSALLVLLVLLVAAYLLLTWLDSPLQRHFDLVLVAALVALVLAPSLGPWTLALGVVIGPVVASERQHGTWVLLGLIPGGIEPVLLAKLRAALWPLRYPLHVLRHVWLVMAFPIAVGVMQGGMVALDLGGDELTPVDQLCAGGGVVLAARILLVVGGMLLYVTDRVQQLLLMALATLGVSTATRSARGALIGGVTAALLAWLVETAGAALLVLQLPGRFAYTDINVLALLILGPAGGYAIDLPVGSALVAALLTLAAREIAVVALWRWSLFAARRFV